LYELETKQEVNNLQFQVIEVLMLLSVKEVGNILKKNLIVKIK